MNINKLIAAYKNKLIDIVNPDDLDWGAIGFDEGKPDEYETPYDCLRAEGEFDESQQTKLKLYEEIIQDLEKLQKASEKTSHWPEHGKMIERVLSANYWPPSLDTQRSYNTTHDDCDGDPAGGWMSVILSVDGDAWIQTHGRGMLRFRMPDIGGGQFPKVRNALLLLAEAIRQEGKDPYK